MKEIENKNKTITQIKHILEQYYGDIKGFKLIFCGDGARYIETTAKEFEAEVEFFAEEKRWVEYYFLKGFWFRYIGKYLDAENYQAQAKESKEQWEEKMSELKIESEKIINKALVDAKQKSENRKIRCF